MENQPIIIERLLNAQIQKVWLAITDKNEMKHWYFDLQEFKPEPGFTFQFTGGPENGIQYLHKCEITEVIPGERLSYSWRYEGYEGSSLVTFELQEQDGKILLTLTHSGIETFPKDNPDFLKKNFEAGWNDIIDDSLKNYVEK